MLMSYMRYHQHPYIHLYSTLIKVLWVSGVGNRYVDELYEVSLASIYIHVYSTLI